MNEPKLYCIMYEYELDDEPRTLHVASMDMDYQTAQILARQELTDEAIEDVEFDEINILEYSDVVVSGYDINLTEKG